jgi:hypothetical protein
MWVSLCQQEAKALDWINILNIWCDKKKCKIIPLNIDLEYFCVIIIILWL